MTRFDEIVKLSTIVHDACKTVAFDKTCKDEYYHQNENLAGMCAIASNALLTALHANGITEAKFVYGFYDEFEDIASINGKSYIKSKINNKESNHCWIEFNKDLIIDITVSQFSNWKKSKIYIGKRTKLHHPIYVYEDLTPSAIFGTGQLWLHSQIKKKSLNNKILKVAGIQTVMKGNKHA